MHGVIMFHCPIPGEEIKTNVGSRYHGTAASRSFKGQKVIDSYEAMSLRWWRFRSEAEREMKVPCASV